MRLKSLGYTQNPYKNGINPWELELLPLSEYNLIVGRNATGKTRIINVIHNLARLIQYPQVVFNGEWSACFINELNQELKFIIELRDGKVTKERLSIDGIEKLLRTESSSKIYSETISDWQDISPPNDRLVLHVRRDKNEFPFLEDIVSWANGVRGFAFANTSPNLIEIPGNPFNLTSLNAVPSALDNLSISQLKKVLKQLEIVGYIIERASTSLIEGLSPNLKMVLLKEQGIAYPFNQFEISQGMFRAFSLLIIIEFLKSSGGIGSILVDDFGEGLDFERSKKLAEIIFGDKSESKIQIIATSNDSFLMNAVPLTDLTISYRTTHKVKCLNYSNSKEKFEEWQQLGLNNFDLFSSNFLLSHQ
jgi:AAA domain, putative AbiEii toxin, Type IV TA system